jgi:hypothetical protein
MGQLNIVKKLSPAESVNVHPLSGRSVLWCSILQLFTALLHQRFVI